ncbi:MAG: sigma 54-interacting transcriptional regulator [Panacagrimonas sp.]
MTLPQILVIDDQLARSTTERFVFLAGAGLTGDHSERGTDTRYAELVFCGAQRTKRDRLVNDFGVVREVVADARFDLLLLDMQFDSGVLDTRGHPRGEPGDADFGLTLQRDLKREFPELAVVMLTSKRQKEIGDTGVPYLSKDGLDEYAMRRTLLRHGRLDAASQRLLLGLDDRTCAEDSATLAAFREAFLHARSDVSILILGESGVGKEVLARYLHRASGRAAGPYFAINVAAIPEGLVESELFGIGKGVASQVSGRQGKLEQATGGTLFLDEIADMPLDVQAKVLRALQERKVVRVGQSEEIPFDVRLVSATSKDLAGLMGSGHFRGDLLYRINTVAITLAPLRTRPADVAPLSKVFLFDAAQKQGKVGLSFSDEALEQLRRQAFPGNVRQLKNLVDRLVSLAGPHQVIGRREVEENLERDGRVTPNLPSSRAPARSAAIPDAGSLGIDDVLNLLAAVPVREDDPALEGAKARLDLAGRCLSQRLAGAALERCRDPVRKSLNRQSAMRLLTGDETLKSKEPARVINQVLGKLQDQTVTDDDLEELIALWKTGPH